MKSRNEDSGESIGDKSKYLEQFVYLAQIKQISCLQNAMRRK